MTPDVVTDRVEERLRKVRKSGEPFFWHVFYSCNHLPYRSPEPYVSMFSNPNYKGANKNGVDFDIDGFIGRTDLENKWEALAEKEVQQIRDLYDGTTRQFDGHVGRILDALQRNGLSENTVVVVTADHGDNLYEEGVTLGHGLTFNGGMQANHVPLVIFSPGVAAQKFPELVRSIDIAPTLLELAGEPVPERWEGRSVAGWLRGETDPEERVFYGETGFPFIQFRVAGIERPQLPPMDAMTRIDETFNYQFVLKEEYEAPLVAAKQRCIVLKQWKLICTPTADGGRHFGLFNMEEGGDPLKDVSAENPKIARTLRDALEKWMNSSEETPAEDILESL